MRAGNNYVGWSCHSDAMVTITTKDVIVLGAFQETKRSAKVHLKLFTDEMLMKKAEIDVESWHLLALDKLS